MRAATCVDSSTVIFSTVFPVLTCCLFVAGNVDHDLFCNAVRLTCDGGKTGGSCKGTGFSIHLQSSKDVKSACGETWKQISFLDCISCHIHMLLINLQTLQVNISSNKITALIFLLSMYHVLCSIGPFVCAQYEMFRYVKV